MNRGWSLLIRLCLIFLLAQASIATAGSSVQKETGGQTVSSSPVFPDLQGFGSGTRGGRGGQVIRVTNLKDQGEGSLRAAVETKGPRIVVFEVAGIIPLQTELAITEPYITIAGQTAPPPGITLRNRRLRVGSHDVVIQHLRSRPGDAKGVFVEYDDRDALTVQDDKNAIYNVVVDHCSFSWAVDEVIGLWGYKHRRLSDITIINSIISEGLNNSLKGFPHSKGVLIGDYAKNVTLIGNLISSSFDRNGPLFKGGSSGIVLNNLVYNSGVSYRLGLADDYNAGPSFVSVVGNVWHDGPANATSAPVWLNPNVKEGTKVYIADNLTLRIDDSPAIVPLIQKNVTWGDPVAKNPTIWIKQLVAQPVWEVEKYVLANAGARPAERSTYFADPVDRRVVNDVTNHTGRIINSPRDVGGYPIITMTTRPFVIQGRPTSGGNGKGYTDIDKQLHRAAEDVENNSGIQRSRDLGGLGFSVWKLRESD